MNTNYYDISLAPYLELINTIPYYQVQGVKVAGICYEKLNEQAFEIARLKEKNGYLNQELYGKNQNKKPEEDDKTEEEAPDPNDPESKFSDEEIAANKDKEVSTKGKLNKTKPEKKTPLGTGKKQTIRLNIPDGLYCACCHKKVMNLGKSGHEAKETDLKEVEIIDRTLHLTRGGCQCGAINIETPRPIRPLDGRVYSSGLVAHLIVHKFRWHTPVYRQNAQLRSFGIDLGRSVMNAMILASWEELEPILKAMKKYIKAQNKRYVDETPIRKVKGKKSKKNYLWCVYSKLGAFFQLTETRNQALAKEIVGEGGTVMTDGLGIYSTNSITGEHANCLAHCLQKFFISFPAFPDESNDAIEYLIKVYDVEKEAKANELTPEERLALRQEKSASIMEEFKSYIENLNPPPESYLAKAIKYTTTRWEELTLFLRDGEIEVDNNLVESLFRDVKLGLKNYLFVQSELGGEALAGFYSLIVTCNMHGVNPQEYISDVLDRIALGHPQSKIDDLLPWNWKPEDNKLKIDSDEDYVEIEYPPELLIKRLGLEGKVFYIPKTDEVSSDPPKHYEIPQKRA